MSFQVFCKRKEAKSDFSFTFEDVCIPQVDENTRRVSGNNQTRTLSSGGRIETGSSIVSSAAVRSSPSDLISLLIELCNDASLATSYTVF